MLKNSLSQVAMKAKTSGSTPGTPITTRAMSPQKAWIVGAKIIISRTSRVQGEKSKETSEEIPPSLTWFASPNCS